MKSLESRLRKYIKDLREDTLVSMHEAIQNERVANELEELLRKS